MIVTARPLAARHCSHGGRSPRSRSCPTSERPVVAERDDFVEQRQRPQMRVLDEAFPAVVDEHVEPIDTGRSADVGDTIAGQIGADRLAVAAEMTGDRRDRPALLGGSACVSTSSSRVSMEQGSLVVLVVVEDRQLRGSPTPDGGPHMVGNFSEQNWGDSHERDHRRATDPIQRHKPLQHPPDPGSTRPQHHTSQFTTTPSTTTTPDSRPRS